jgi:hypothetical protein
MKVRGETLRDKNVSYKVTFHEKNAQIKRSNENNYYRKIVTYHDSNLFGWTLDRFRREAILIWGGTVYSKNPSEGHRGKSEETQIYFWLISNNDKNIFEFLLTFN